MRKHSSSSSGDYALVTRDRESREIYIDSKTRLLWSFVQPVSNHDGATQGCANFKSQMIEGTYGAKWRLPKKNEILEARGKGLGNISQYGIDSFIWGAFEAGTVYGNFHAFTSSLRPGGNYRGSYEALYIDDTFQSICVSKP